MSLSRMVCRGGPLTSSPAWNTLTPRSTPIRSLSSRSFSRCNHHGSYSSNRNNNSNSNSNSNNNSNSNHIHHHHPNATRDSSSLSLIPHALASSSARTSRARTSLPLSSTLRARAPITTITPTRARPARLETTTTTAATATAAATITTTATTTTTTTQRRQICTEIRYSSKGMWEEKEVNADELTMGNFFRGMAVSFHGTGSGSPSEWREPTSVSIQLDGEHWLFDVGEGTQKRIMYGDTPARLRSVTKIFITHMHGDHVFGLPGILTSICGGKSGEPFSTPPTIEVYGPRGIIEFVKANLGITQTSIRARLTINEMRSFSSNKDNNGFRSDRRIHENYLYPDDDGVFHLFENESYTVKAGPLKHTIPTYGYSVEEKDKVGRFSVDQAESLGVPRGKLFGDLQRGLSVRNVDGDLVEPHQVLSDPRRGRKVVILGDLSWTKHTSLFAHADVLVHEATLPNDQRDDAINRGHSTVDMACAAAQKMRAKVLFLTHFGAKMQDLLRHKHYSNNAVVDGAKSAFPRPILLAEEFMTVYLPLKPIEGVDTTEDPMVVDRAGPRQIRALARDHLPAFVAGGPADFDLEGDRR